MQKPEKDAAYEKVLAHLHLYAVLPRLAELVARDAAARELVKDWNLTMQFHIRQGPAVQLNFRRGAVEVKRGAQLWPEIAFWFFSPSGLNKMFTGGKTIPIVWKGVWYPGKLKTFIKLSERLDSYLRPREELTADPQTLALIVEMQLYIMVFALKEVAECDLAMTRAVHHLPPGIAEFRVLPDGPVAHVEVRDGRLYPGKGPASNPRVVLILKDTRTAYALLQNKLDLMAAVGMGDLKIQGYIPLLDALDPLMNRLSAYLA